MRKIGIFAVAIAMSSMLPYQAVSAQRSASSMTAADAVRQSYQAEHQAWLDDFKRWQAEHQQAERTLRDMLAQLTSDNRLNTHIREVEEHGRELANREADLSAMATVHARQRSEHEEMRAAHNQVMTDIARLRTDMERDLGPASPVK